jgi:hypothetical protein
VHGTDIRAQDIGDPTSICPWSNSHYGINMYKPGAQAYYDDWIALLASYDVDFIKADDMVPHPREIKAVIDAIAKTGRPIVLSLSPGDVWKDEHLDAYRLAGMVRITRDIHDRPGDIDAGFDNWLRFSQLIEDPASPGVWPDLDMIPFGRIWIGMSDGGARRGRGRAGTGPASRAANSPTAQVVAPVATQPGRASRYTAAEKRTFITQRAMAASPLFISGSLLHMEPEEVRLLTDPQMIACNQNGVVGRRVWAADGIEVWRTPRRDQENEGWIGVFNRNAQARPLELSVQQLGLESNTTYSLRDIWQSREAALVNGAIEVNISGNDVCFLKYEPAGR